jgi:DNA-binding transcriptional MerR regulator
MVEGLHLGAMMKLEAKTPLKIGDLARIADVPEKTIRYYERRGLLDPAARSEAGYRLYGPEEAARLRFIKRAKLLGLTLNEIRELVELAAGCNEGEIVPRLEEVLDAKLAEVDRKMGELTAFRENLLYYRRRASEGVPVDRTCGDDASFCGCLEVVTGKGGEQGEEG